VLSWKVRLSANCEGCMGHTNEAWIPLSAIWGQSVLVLQTAMEVKVTRPQVAYKHTKSVSSIVVLTTPPHAFSA
jgi:hypothetical protein